MRTLSAAILLPAAVVCFDQLAFAAAVAERWRWLPTFCLFAAFMAQTSLLCFAVSRWLPNWYWRSGVLTWTLVLTNLLLFRAVAEAGYFCFWWSAQNPVQLLTAAFLSAQVAVGVVGFILGSAPLGTKALLTAAFLAPPVATIALLLANDVGRIRAEFWDAVSLVQLVATICLSALLQALGWRIAYVEGSDDGPRAAWLQFSIRHLIIATTTVAILTAVGKAVVTQSAGGMEWKEWLHVAIDGCLLGLLSLVAVWAALGAGRRAVRLPLFFLIAAMLGGLLWWAEARAKTNYVSAGGPRTIFEWQFVQSLAERWWLSWTLLAGTFLASWLSVLRAAGYRLVRRRR